MSDEKEMSCAIYKTNKHDGLYLYVKEQDDFSDIPDEVMRQFEEPEHVFNLVLSGERPLAREDVLLVMKNLNTQGFHLQMPPKNKDSIDTFQLPDSLHG